jgi:hypothetical protein
MGKELPSGLVATAAEVGFAWPKADEDMILKHARGWYGMQTQLSSRDYSPVWRLFDDNEGEATDAFRTFWIRRGGQELQVAKAAGAVSGALTVHANAISTLKTFAITELTMLKNFLDRFNWPSWIGGPDADEVAWQNRQAIDRVRETLQAKRQIAISQITQAADVLGKAQDPFGLGDISRDLKELGDAVGSPIQS